MEDIQSQNLMELNEQRIKILEQIRRHNFTLILNYFKRIVKYILMGKWGYAVFALKRALKVATTKRDDNYDKVAESTGKIEQCERIVIYTVLFGNYDDLKEPMFITPNCDYFIVTNQEVKPESIWKKFSLDKFNNLISGYSNLEKARFFKLHPHLLFPEYKYSMFIDANLQMVTDMRPVFCQLGGNFIAIHNQPGRDCAYQEATEIIVINKAPKDEVNRQMNAYKIEGFPEHYGLFRTCVVVREHNSELCINLMDVWWKNIFTYTKRDQLSFTYSLWKLGLDKKAVSNLGYDIRTNPRFIESIHINHQ